MLPALHVLVVAHVHHICRLLQVSVFCPEEPGQRARSIDAAVFQQLPKLNCLTVAGGWGREQWACFVAAPACGTRGARAGWSLVQTWMDRWMDGCGYSMCCCCAH